MLRGDLRQVITGFHRVGLFASRAWALSRGHPGSRRRRRSGRRGDVNLLPDLQFGRLNARIRVGDGFDGDVELLGDLREDIAFAMVYSVAPAGTTGWAGGSTAAGAVTATGGCCWSRLAGWSSRQTPEAGCWQLSPSAALLLSIARILASAGPLGRCREWRARRRPRSSFGHALCSSAPMRSPVG